MITYLPIKVSSTYKSYRTIWSDNNNTTLQLERRIIEVPDELGGRELERGTHTHGKNEEYHEK